MFIKNRGARRILRKTWIFRFWTASITSTKQFGARAEKSWFLNRKSSGPIKIIKSEQLFYSIASCWCSKPCSRLRFFGKSSMGTLEKLQKCYEKSINTRYFVKNTDFQLLNGFDHVYEAIRTWSWKIVIFEPKIVRTDQNHQKWTAFLPNRLALVFKTTLKTVIFRKILDGDPRKIAEMSRKIDQH